MNLRGKRISLYLTVATIVCLSTGLQCVSAADNAEWIDLFNGRDLSGWILVNPDGSNGWRVVDGDVRGGG